MTALDFQHASSAHTAAAAQPGNRNGMEGRMSRCADITGINNLGFWEDLYLLYRRDPDGVAPAWRECFASLGDDGASGAPRLGPAFRPRSVFDPAPDSESRARQSRFDPRDAALRDRLNELIRNYRMQSITDFAQRARQGKLLPEHLEGGTFTITNGGLFASMLSTPLINSPQAGILGLHAIEERPVARQGQVMIRPIMYVALTYDHRLVDGREAVLFLRRIKECIEEPARLLVEV